MPVREKGLIGATTGAVAPTVALSLFALIAVGGIAFDYARLAGMDSELQSAADQAALAAATQLDGKSTAITRATAAAQTLIQNSTRFSNDGSTDGRSIKVETPGLVFFSAYNDTTETGTETTDPLLAKFVQVTVKPRQARYALTPVVAAISSGDIDASAVAGLGNAVCKVPPLMFCSFGENFPESTDIGRGLKLQPGPQTGAWVPGDYGYLDFGNGASGLATNLGSNQEFFGCFDSSHGIQTEPGNKASVTKALNTRFDLYEPGVSSCDTSNGDYCPAENTTKDFVKKEVVEIKNVSGPTVPPNPGCGTAGATVTDFEQRASAKGFTRDTCHIGAAAVPCTSNLGDGVWDVAGYFGTNHPLATVPSGSAAHRYNVYLWELADKANRLPSRFTNPLDPPATKTTGKGAGAKTDYTYTNYCAYPQPKNGTGVPSSTSQKDRRVVTVAQVDCTGLNGKGTIKIQNWVDVFLVEPSADRSTPYSTGKSQIYGEIIGIATKPGGSDAFQYFSRNKPYLVK